jgi:hypothetical protein
VANSDDSERSKRYLDMLYDHSKQLVTLSTASATVLVALYPNNVSVPKLVISLALLALSVVCGVFCLAFVTSMMGDGQNYSSGGRLTATPANKRTIALFFCHVLCVGFLLVGVFTFAIWKFAPLTFEPPATPPGRNTMTELRGTNTGAMRTSENTNYSYSRQFGRRCPYTDGVRAAVRSVSRYL